MYPHRYSELSEVRSLTLWIYDLNPGRSLVQTCDHHSRPSPLTQIAAALRETLTELREASGISMLPLTLVVPTQIHPANTAIKLMCW